VFLNDAARSYVNSYYVLIISLFACLSLQVGEFFLGRIRCYFEGKKLFFRIDRAGKKSIFFACLSLSFILLGIWLYGVDYFFSGYNIVSDAATASSGNVLIFFFYEIIGLSLYVFLTSNERAGRLGLVVLVGVYAVLMFFMIIRGKRIEFIIACLPFFLYLWGVKVKSLYKRFFLVFICVVFVSSMASFRYGEIPTMVSLLFNSFSEGAFAGHVTPGVVDALRESRISFEYGARLIATVLAFVPRFVFPDKDVFVYSSLVDVSEYAPLGATSYLAEVYLQFGLLGVIAWFFGLGMFSGYLKVGSWRELCGDQVRIIGVLYVICITSMVMHFRDGLIPSVKMPMQIMVLYFLCYVVDWRKFSVRYRFCRVKWL